MRRLLNILIYVNKTDTGTITVAGGTGGAKTGASATVGIDGQEGTLIELTL